MLNQEKIAQFEQLIASNTPCAPEDQADFEVYKALKMSQTLAAQAAAPTPAQMPAPIAQTAAPAPVEVYSAEVVRSPVEAVQVVRPASGSFYSMDDLAANTMSADKYIKVRNQQTSVGGELIANKEIFAVLNFSDVRAKQSIKGGNPVKYYSTVDGRTCIETGGAWIDAINDIKKIARDARPYSCVDFTVSVAKDLVGYDGNIIAPVGTRLGHTTATTNWKNWLKFWQTLPSHEGKVFVKITRVDVKKDSNQWALLDFEYVPDDAAASIGLIG
jgi:hypothetical protein